VALGDALVSPDFASETACGKYGKNGKFSASFLGEKQIPRMSRYYTSSKAEPFKTFRAFRTFRSTEALTHVSSGALRARPRGE
jgi:hypothetical protein